MRLAKTERGFGIIHHPVYPTPDTGEEETRLVQCSSAIGTSADIPGASYLWVGEKHHLDRFQVLALVHSLTTWLTTGSLGKC